MHDTPMRLFAEWFNAADKHPTIKEANAMCLATADKNGRPTSRMVLMKDYSEAGFVFYTNLDSRKAVALQDNPYASLCFFWPQLDKQVRIEGRVQPVSSDTADAYFASRSLQSKIGAWSSKQSQPLPNSNTLLKDIAYYTKHFATHPLTRPPFWSGFCVRPERIEFWSRGTYRIHKRTVFSRTSADNWSTQLLYP